MIEDDRVCASGLQQREQLQLSPSGLRHVFETKWLTAHQHERQRKAGLVEGLRGTHGDVG